MSLTKQFLKSKPVCKVRFHLSSEEAQGWDEAFVAGEFNGWDTQACPMKRNKDGSFSVLLELETGREYQFRYVGNGQWRNDGQADKYAFCPYSSEENSVVCL